MKWTRLLILATSFFASLRFAFEPFIPQPIHYYFKIGTGYYSSHSSNFYLSRQHPIQGSVEPPLAQASQDGKKLGLQLTFGSSYPLCVGWRVCEQLRFSPELAYVRAGEYSKELNPFTIDTPPDFSDVYGSTVNINIVSANFKFAYLINHYWSVYLTPGLGVAFLETTNSLSFQSPEDAIVTNYRSSERTKNFSPQVSAGLTFLATDHLSLDVGISYLWLGKIPSGKFSLDADEYTATMIKVKDAYLWGPTFSLTFSI